MKKQFPAFLLGVFATILVGGLTVTALAASGQMTITVDPINIQVNGETFQPKDVNGQDVAVFAYNGTTYAPLRALAEAYGLEVGYDPEANMATVKAPEEKMQPDDSTVPDDSATEPDYVAPVFDWSEEEEAAYQEFKGMWEVSTVDAKYMGPVINLRCERTESDVDSFLENTKIETVEKFCVRLDTELFDQYQRAKILYFFGLRGTWGWMDEFSNGVWQCGYRCILDE